MKTAAVIGCGRMGAFTSENVKRFAPASWFPLSHADAFAAHPGTMMTALCDPDDGMRARAQATYGVANVFADHHALLAAGAPDMVGIATRTQGRAQIIADCAAAGTRAFHVEKPLCTTMAELDTMAALFARDDIHVTFGAIRRLMPAYIEAKRLADSGVYGRLLEIRVNLGAGALYWTHPHSVDLILFAAGERTPVTVTAMLGSADIDGTTVRNDPVVEAATLFFDDGVIGHIGRAPGCDLMLACERGEIAVVNDGHALTLNAPEGDDPYPVRRTLDFVSPAGLQGVFLAVDQLVRCLDGDVAARADNAALKQDILAGQRLLFAMAASHIAGGAPVDPATLDASLRIDALTNGRPA